ncbi:glycosyltransferase family 4 protein [Blastopirellula sp. JC732]|uniref:Glycosyltransferase family 4 protein n=1 Tax=Blastopirellula sediminis TaxID=2894196 RepID=A0A9X1MIC7_9BACT|nr:glycosyltransferase family 1 protein [Blastopirellula sediminis]MCC9609591.1 glycosyltransferase family 4 protein [Blastopirellula sediminis]MCC9627633.1 glycosyltransferase family 4 protein [Blastopirellula sediminis]
MSSPIQRLLIDVTHTAKGDVNHGIQRVVRNIAKHALAYSETHALECVPVLFEDGQFVLVDDACIERGFRKTHPDTLRWRKEIVRRILPQSSVGIEQALVRARKLLYPRTIARAIERFFARRSGPPQPANPGSGDVLLLPDAWWDIPMYDALAAAQQNGAIVGTMIQDLIPVYHPELCHDRFAPSFQRWIQKALHAVDFVLGNSQTTRDDLWNFVQQEQAPLADWQVRPVRLGCDIESHAEVAEDQIAPRIRDLFVDEDAAPYLMVSTIEIRKNHKLLLDAFDKMWEQGSEASVALVGRIGWKCNDLLERIKTHPQYGKRLMLLTDIGDAELAYIYQKSKAFIFPSLAEGFGLPIAEALHHGLHVFASDLAIHQEVGGPHCSYFSPHDPAELVQLIGQFEREQGWRTPIQAPPVNHPWSLTFENIVRECESIATKLSDQANVRSQAA